MKAGLRLGAVALFLAFLILIPCLSMKAQASVRVWHTETVYSQGNVGQYLDLALSTWGWPRICFYESDRGCLWYASKNGLEWDCEIVDGYVWDNDDVDVGAFCSLALDSEYSPCISYADSTNHELKYATMIDDSWTLRAIDNGNKDDPDKFPVGPNFVGTYTSLVLDSDNPNMIYYDYSRGDLKSTVQTGFTDWEFSVVDEIGQVGSDYTSLAVDEDGNLHVCYYDWVNKDLKYAAKEQGFDWLSETVDSEGDVGKFCSIAVDSVGMVHMSYYDADHQCLKHAYGTIGGFSVETVNAASGFLHVGEWTSIAIDSHNYPHIAYCADDGLHYASYDGTSWTDEHVDTVGYGTSLALYDDRACIAYYDFANGDVKYAYQMESDPEIESCNISGNQQDAFSLTDTGVNIKGTGFANSTTYPLHVVVDVQTWLNGMDIPKRLENSLENIGTNTNGEITPTVVWDPTLPGKFDIIIDVNGNSKYDAGVDVLDDNDVQTTAGFFVASPVVESCDDTGAPKNTFILRESSSGEDQESIYVVGSGFAANTEYPSFIVNDFIWTDGVDIPPRLEYSTEYVATNDEGYFDADAWWLWFPDRTGQFDILIDVNDNGKYDAGIDALDTMVEVVSGTFVVPEYAFGALMALAICFGAFVIHQKQNSHRAR
ncbi:MAG: hypothetical protein NWE92_02900 [Candidatus Bathyarchaeota archaeon]|nr:hypothetical protein [Candidatus Bathyarchaeota archaeon]